MSNLPVTKDETKLFVKNVRIKHDEEIAKIYATKDVVSVEKNGLAPKLPGDAEKVLNGKGAWTNLGNHLNVTKENNCYYMSVNLYDQNVNSSKSRFNMNETKFTGNWTSNSNFYIYDNGIELANEKNYIDTETERMIVELKDSPVLLQSNESNMIFLYNVYKYPIDGYKKYSPQPLNTVSSYEIYKYESGNMPGGDADTSKHNAHFVYGIYSINIPGGYLQADYYNYHGNDVIYHIAYYSSGNIGYISYSSGYIRLSEDDLRSGSVTHNANVVYSVYKYPAIVYNEYKDRAWVTWSTLVDKYPNYSVLLANVYYYSGAFMWRGGYLDSRASSGKEWESEYNAEFRYNVYIVQKVHYYETRRVYYYESGAYYSYEAGYGYASSLSHQAEEFKYVFKYDAGPRISGYQIDPNTVFGNPGESLRFPSHLSYTMYYYDDYEVTIGWSDSGWSKNGTQPGHGPGSGGPLYYRVFYYDIPAHEKGFIFSDRFGSDSFDYYSNFKNDSGSSGGSASSFFKFGATYMYAFGYYPAGKYDYYSSGYLEVYYGGSEDGSKHDARFKYSVYSTYYEDPQCYFDTSNIGPSDIVVEHYQVFFYPRFEYNGGYIRKGLSVSYDSGYIDTRISDKNKHNSRFSYPVYKYETKAYSRTNSHSGSIIAYPVYEKSADTVFTRTLVEAFLENIDNEILIIKTKNNKYKISKSGIPTASSTQLGGVKINGNGLSIDSNGFLSCNITEIPTASSTQLGGVKINGNGLSIDSNGLLKVTVNRIILDTVPSDVEGSMWIQD